jgi:hypothetical protein
VKALSDEHNDHASKHDGVALHHGDSDYRIRGSVTGGPGGSGLPRDLTPGAGAQWDNLGIAHVGARADRGDAGRRVSAEEATEPHSQKQDAKPGKNCGQSVMSSGRSGKSMSCHMSMLCAQAQAGGG